VTPNFLHRLPGIVLAVCMADCVAFDAPAQSSPCGLLTSAQVTAAAGVTVGNGSPIGSTGCSWSAAGFIVSLSVADAGKWQQMKAGLPGAAINSISGLGDDSFSSTIGTGHSFVVLNVRKAATVYKLKIYGVADAAKQLSIEEALARAVLANL
jgi:hypothetical protein